MTGESFFHRMYYKGYSRKIVMDENNDLHSEYVYEGIYYVLDSTDSVWKRRKAEMLLLFLLSAGSLIWTMTDSSPLNYKTGITVLEMLGLLLELGMAVCIYCRLTAGRKMTDWDYRMSVISIKEFAMVLLFCLALAAVLGIGFLIFGAVPFSAAALLLPAKLLVGAAIAGIMMLLVKKEKYTTQVSEDLPHGIDVTSDFETEDEEGGTEF